MEMEDTRSERVESTSSKVREVWASNLLDELPLIMEAGRSFPYVAVDTEFPGVLHHTPRFADAHHRYRVMKLNVDAMKLIQLGLSFFGAGGRGRRTWQINLREFDVSSPADARAEASIELLRNSGVDLERTRRDGVDSQQLSELLSRGSWIGGSGRRPKWVTFHGAYDVAYLMKLLTRAPLPESLSGFGQLVGRTLGSVFDTKYMATFCGGMAEGRLGLARLSEILQLKVDGAGTFHQAGHDSLVTGMAFERMAAEFHVAEDLLQGILCGIELEKIVPQTKESDIAVASEQVTESPQLSEGRRVIQMEEKVVSQRMEVFDEMPVTVPSFYHRPLNGLVVWFPVPVPPMPSPSCGWHYWWT